jgi:hypothetical protein
MKNSETIGDPINKKKVGLPDSARHLYELLARDMIELNARWNMYKQIYLDSPSRIALLEKSGSVFFGRLQRMLLSDVVLGITRLSDPPHQNKFENQSLLRLGEELLPRGSDQLTKLLKHRLAEIESKCSPFRSHRNKRFAHKDLHYAVAPHEVALPRLSAKNFEAAIKSLDGFLNDVEEHFDDLVFTG